MGEGMNRLWVTEDGVRMIQVENGSWVDKSDTWDDDGDGPTNGLGEPLGGSEGTALDPAQLAQRDSTAREVEAFVLGTVFTDPAVSLDCEEVARWTAGAFRLAYTLAIVF